MRRRVVNVPWDFASQLRDRLDLGLTQKEAARIAGVSVSWLSRMEQSGQRAQLGLVCDLVPALGLELTLGERTQRRHERD